MPGPQPLTSLFGIGGVIELVAGALIMIGLFTRPAAFIAAGEMAVAYWMFHAPQSPFPVANNGDAAILYCFLFLYLVAAGPGAFSVDGARSRAR
jgi:putative oxidoreductase